LHPHLKKKVRSSLKRILSNPDEGRPLRDELAGLQSFRVNRFRIICRVQKNIVEVIAVGPRERIYEETFFLLKRKIRD
jgi:mRNA-degrading endonuclease RelE of RelBE toxin-antitoxin system